MKIGEDGTCEIHAKGHANYAERGKDIVCASVSILIYTLIESIDERELSLPPVIEAKAGETLIRVKPKSENRGKICAVFEVIANGFELLQKNFPENVKFRRVGG
jgi:uncharacterized protein YsxB (DUF464 family)